MAEALVDLATSKLSPIRHPGESRDPLLRRSELSAHPVRLERALDPGFRRDDDLESGLISHDGAAFPANLHSNVRADVPRQPNSEIRPSCAAAPWR